METLSLVPEVGNGPPPPTSSAKLLLLEKINVFNIYNNRNLTPDIKNLLFKKKNL